MWVVIQYEVFSKKSDHGLQVKEKSMCSLLIFESIRESALTMYEILIERGGKIFKNFLRFLLFIFWFPCLRECSPVKRRLGHPIVRVTNEAWMRLPSITDRV
jgi:hypothetical protein